MVRVTSFIINHQNKNWLTENLRMSICVLMYMYIIYLKLTLCCGISQSPVKCSPSVFHFSGQRGLIFFTFLIVCYSEIISIAILHQNTVRVVIFQSLRQDWHLIRLYHLGKLSQVKPNSFFNQLVVHEHLELFETESWGYGWSIPLKLIITSCLE